MAGEFCHRRMLGSFCILASGHPGDCRFCRCGPNEACSRCSTPRPRGPLRCPCGAEGLHNRTPLCPPACPHGLSYGCGLCERPTGVFFGQRFAEDAPDSPYAATAEDAAKAAARRLECPFGQPPCAHQWLLLDGKAWCPNCDVVRAPPEDVT